MVYGNIGSSKTNENLVDMPLEKYDKLEDELKCKTKSMNMHTVFKKSRLVIGIGLFLVFGCVEDKKEEKKNDNESQKEYKIVGYVVGSKMTPNFLPIEAKKLTHINYAFADIEDGKVVDISDKATNNFKYLNSLKSNNKDLKILISIGGWGRSGGFSDAVLTDESRQKFANSCLVYLQRNNLDGIDLDWEYPGLPGAGNTHRPEDKENFTAVLGLLRKKLDSLGGEDDTDYLLTIATGASQNYLDNVEMHKIHPYLDFINIMTYDFHGAYDKSTFHHTNLFESKTDTTANRRSSSNAVAEHVKAGAPIGKLVLGVAFYGRGWRGVAKNQNGLHELASKGGFDLSFKAISDSLKNSSYKRYWDNDAKAPYAWSQETASFITYDDEESLGEKSKFIIEKGMGGAMFWEYNADNENRLLKTLNEKLR